MRTLIAIVLFVAILFLPFCSEARIVAQKGDTATVYNDSTHYIVRVDTVQVGAPKKDSANDRLAVTYSVDTTIAPWIVVDIMAKGIKLRLDEVQGTKQRESIIATFYKRRLNWVPADTLPERFAEWVKVAFPQTKK